MEIKVLIVDDEPGMRLLLRKIIEKVEGVKVLSEAKNAEEALEILMKETVDLIFLDIEMGELNGVDAAKAISLINPKIKIIFATAYGEYMGSAFEVYAYDYLLKPFKIDRVFSTLERFKREFKEKEKSENSFKDKIMIKSKDCSSFIDKDNIIFAERKEGTTIIYTKDEKYKSSIALSELEEKLGNKEFFRSHKSYIVSKAKIEKIYPYGRWTYIIKFKDLKEDALITQKKYEELKVDLK